MNQGTGKELSSISSISTTWHWRQVSLTFRKSQTAGLKNSSCSGSDIVADVSYDKFTSCSASGNNAYQIMVWLAAYGAAGPISSSGSPIAYPSIGGVTWKLDKGPNGSTTAFPFVAESTQPHFPGDLHNFLSYST